jgi:hypothetical protein
MPTFGLLHNYKSVNQSEKRILVRTLICCNNIQQQRTTFVTSVAARGEGQGAIAPGRQREGAPKSRP